MCERHRQDRKNAVGGPTNAASLRRTATARLAAALDCSDTPQRRFFNRASHPVISLVRWLRYWLSHVASLTIFDASSAGARPLRRTEGVECRKDPGVVDETPAAYKDIDAVMAAQKDLVEVVYALEQVVCLRR
jgi:hypothetical protein